MFIGLTILQLIPGRYEVRTIPPLLYEDLEAGKHTDWLGLLLLLDHFLVSVTPLDDPLTLVSVCTSHCNPLNP